jgi:hypothetical protein
MDTSEGYQKPECVYEFECESVAVGAPEGSPDAPPQVIYTTTNGIFTVPEVHEYDHVQIVLEGRVEPAAKPKRGV